MKGVRGSEDTYSPPLRHGIGKTITLSAGQSGSKQWWVTKNSSGRSAANDPVCLRAIQKALHNSDRADVVTVFWADPPDSSVPQEFHSALATVGDWLAIHP
jgi:hypothetical protein